MAFTVSGNLPLGNASVACEGGCGCDPATLVGRTRYPITVMAQTAVPLRDPGAGCALRLRATGGRVQVRTGRRAAPQRAELPCGAHMQAATMFCLQCRLLSRRCWDS